MRHYKVESDASTQPRSHRGCGLVISCVWALRGHNRLSLSLSVISHHVIQLMSVEDENDECSAASDRFHRHQQTLALLDYLRYYRNQNSDSSTVIVEQIQIDIDLSSFWESVLILLSKALKCWGLAASELPPRLVGTRFLHHIALRFVICSHINVYAVCSLSYAILLASFVLLVISIV